MKKGNFFLIGAALLVIITFVPLYAASGKTKLDHARQLLTGSDKKLVQAQQELLALAKEGASGLDPERLCFVYVYLGYIEDIQGNRAKAIEWFQRAANLEGQNIAGIQEVAKIGLDKPITWIRHLDKDSSSTAREGDKNEKNVIDRIGRTVILAGPPKNLPLQQHLTQAEMEENFENLIQAVDRYFSFFIIKDIQWESVCQEYREKLKETKSAPQFYRLVERFVSELKDAHSWLQDYKSKSRLDTFAPPISIRRIEGKPVVVDVWKQSKAYREGVRPGWVITAVDRKPVDRYMKLLRNRVSVSSSERNLLEKITRMVLCGKKESTIKVDFLTNKGQTKRNMSFARSVRYPETEPELPFSLTKLSKIWYGTHSSGLGYIRITSFSGRMEIADEFDRALAELRNTKGLIIDIRDNPGGYGTCQRRIIGRFLTSEAEGMTSFKRNGPKHSDFKVIPESINPSGEWQYTKPVGLLMNSITGSASDLFAARFVSTGRVVTMGQTTHGNVTGVGVYIVLPCNLVVRISNGYIADSSGRVIEGNGNKPDIIIEPTLADAREYTNGVLERAFVQLQKRATQ